MKSLNLNHQKITTLTKAELTNIKGGGEKNSNRKMGNCGYSRKHPGRPHTADPYCLPKNAAAVGFQPARNGSASGN
ncbi:MAG: hypothetical protein ACFB10_00905 [Salibacteraceae bacterium]